MRNFVNLGEYTRIRTGKLDANASSPNGKYPFFTCSQEPLRIESYSYDCECVLVAGNGDLNVKYYNGKFDAYQRTYIIESLDKDKLLPRYMFYFLELYIETLRKESIGGVIKYIKLGNLTNAKIFLPDLATQQKIIDILDKSVAAIARRKKQLASCDMLVKSQFIEMFEGEKYPDCPIKELVTGRVESVRKRYKPEDRIRYVDISSIDNKLNQMTGYTEYSLQEAPSRAQQCIEKGDILVSTVRPNLRNIAMNTFDDDHMVASSGFCVLRATTCNRSYLLAALLLDKFSRKMSELTTGANYPAIKDSDVLGYRIPRPPIERQNEFARFVEQTDKSKVLLAIELFFHLYTAICLKAFEKSSQMMYNHG